MSAIEPVFGQRDPLYDHAARRLAPPSVPSPDVEVDPVRPQQLADEVPAIAPRRHTPSHGVEEYPRLSSEASARLQSKLAQWQGNLTRMLDMLGEGVMLINGVGRVLHQNRATVRLLSADPEQERLMDDIRRLAQSLASAARRAKRRGSSSLDLDSPTVRELRTARARYRIRVTSLRDFLETGEISIVALENSASSAPSVEGVQGRFGLTRQEARVALLLAEGRSNAEIARELAISPHTARHHTEHVLVKLDARSRAELGAKILRAD